jgi:hypothetical protein
MMAIKANMSVSAPPSCSHCTAQKVGNGAGPVALIFQDGKDAIPRTDFLIRAYNLILLNRPQKCLDDHLESPQKSS